MKRASIALFFAVTACGYQALYASDRRERLHVALVRVAIASGAVGAEVAEGAREELARQGALGSGDGYPRLEIEVTGASESSEGIGLSVAGRAPAAPTFAQTPTARATRVALVATSRVVRAAGAEPERESGDLRVEDVLSAGESDPVASTFSYQNMQRAAARRLGRKLAARALGDPAASEGLGR